MTYADLYEELKRGEVFGRYYGQFKYPYFGCNLWYDPEFDLFCYSHYGSSAVLANIQQLEWLLPTIFGCTPDEFVKLYVRRSVARSLGIDC